MSASDQRPAMRATTASASSGVRQPCSPLLGFRTRSCECWPPRRCSRSGAITRKGRKLERTRTTDAASVVCFVASTPPSRAMPHDSGPLWAATPSTYDFFIRIHPPASRRAESVRSQFPLLRQPSRGAGLRRLLLLPRLQDPRQLSCRTNAVLGGDAEERIAREDMAPGMPGDQGIDVRHLEVGCHRHCGHLFKPTMEK